MIYVYYNNEHNAVSFTDNEDAGNCILLGTFESMPKGNPKFIADALLTKNKLQHVQGISVLVAPGLG